MFRYIPEGLGCSCGPDWYTHNEEYNCTSYVHFLMVTCFIAPLTIIIFSYSQLLGALRAVSSTPDRSVVRGSGSWSKVWFLVCRSQPSRRSRSPPRRRRRRCRG